MLGRVFLWCISALPPPPPTLDFGNLVRWMMRDFTPRGDALEDVAWHIPPPSPRQRWNAAMSVRGDIVALGCAVVAQVVAHFLE